MIGKFDKVDDACVLYLTDKKKSATLWSDLSGNGNNGTIYGATASRLGYLFDGVDDYINLGNSGSLKVSTDFSYSFWINRTSGGGIFQTSNDLGTGALVIFYGNSNIEVNIIFVDSYVFNQLSGSLSDGVWHYIVITRNSSNVWKLYYEGILNTQVTVASNSTYWNGNYISQTTEQGRINGQIYNFRIYNRALSASEILNMYGKTRKFYGV